MTVRKGLGQANILRTNNNTSTGYGIVYADEVSGHRTVGSLADLYVLHDWQLSASGDNTNNDAIGQLWYVVDADGNGNGCYYQLKDWSKRKEAAGWQQFNPTSDLSDFVNKDELAATESAIQKQIATKANAQDVTNAIGELQDSIKNIAVTGGASTAAAVTFDNAASGMNAVTAQAAIDELNSKISEEITVIEQHFFNYDENFRNITSKIKLSKRYTNYLIGYYNTKNSQYELYRYTRTEFSDAYWNNKIYWNIIPCKSFELFVQIYKDIYYNQSFNCNNLRRIQDDEAMNLLDTSISLGVAIQNNGVIQKGSNLDVEKGSDRVIQGPIYVKQLDNVVIYSEDRTVPNNKPNIYKYDEVGNFISKINVTTFPFIIDVSDCAYIFVESWRNTNLQVVPGTTPFPASSKLWAFRSLYSEGVILPYNLYYLDNLLLPYYVENISINKGVELYGSFTLNIINREELFIPKREGVININVGYGYRDAGAVMQTQIKKARLSTANKSPKILCIGDSFTEIGTWQITLKDNLENLGINAEFIGAMHSVNTVLNKVGVSENQTGGKLKANFIDAVAGKCYLVKVNGLSEKTMPINFNRYVTYTSNGYTWTVWGYNLSEEGNGTMRLYCTDGAASLSETGVLTKKSGTGDASINYTNATEVNKNPFYNPSEQKFDPQYYLSAWGFDKPDVVCLMFGANDMTRNTFNKTFWKDVKDFIDAWKNVLPDTKFVIGSSKLYFKLLLSDSPQLFA